MRKVLAIAGIAILSLVSCKSEPKTENKADKTAKVEVVADGVYMVKTNQTINWEGYKPTGSHNGTIGVKEGKVEVKEGKITSGNFVFDMTSITVLDIPADDKYNAKLKTHLMKDDFFSTEKHPTATFTISKVEGSNVTGNLTIKEVTKPITFVMETSKTANEVKLLAKDIQIDRTEFGIKYKSKKFFENIKDKFINDNFKISFNLEAAK